MPTAATAGRDQPDQRLARAHLGQRADGEHHRRRDQPRQQQRGRGEQRPGQAGRPQQPRRRPLEPAGRAAPYLRRDVHPHAVEVDAIACRAGTLVAHLIVHRAPPSAARSSRRARCARLFTVPSGTPISSATSATGRSSSYSSRHTSRSGQPGGPSAAAAAVARSARTAADSAGSAASGPSSSRAMAAGPRLPQQQGGLIPRDHPQPGLGRALGPVGLRVLPHGQERLLQHVLDVVRRQRLTEPGGQPRGMPGKQLPQRRVITAGQARDQLVVVHHPSIAPDAAQVHDQRKKIKIDYFERTVALPPGTTGGEPGSTGNGRSGRSQGPFDSIDFELSFGR